MPELPPLSHQELIRYSRHLILPGVGLEGQRRLKNARVLLVGAGGLGSPAALYLAAAGVGTIGLVDMDAVDVTNLQRQMLHGTADGRHLEARLRDRPPARPQPPGDGRAVRNPADFGQRAEDAGVLRCDVDGSDNFPTRYLINDACVLLGKPEVYGSIFQFDGQVSVFDASRGPCYRCLFQEPPPPGLVPSCAEGGVLGVLPGIVGSIQALEAMKLILGAGEGLVGRLLLVRRPADAVPGTAAAERSRPARSAGPIRRPFAHRLRGLLRRRPSRPPGGIGSHSRRSSPGAGPRNRTAAARRAGAVRVGDRPIAEPRA